MPPTKMNAVIAAAFEPDSGPIPGELHHFLEREALTRQLPFPAGYRPLALSEEGILGIITGVGPARAAASIMALGLDPRFDLTRALWLITGVAGADPARASLASVVLPEYVIDGSLTHEIDAREIPDSEAWPDGFVPIGKSTPYEQPREPRFNGDDGIVFRLNPDLVTWAHQQCRNLELDDTDQVATRRQQFTGPAAHAAPSVLRGDELASPTFYHGELLRQRARRWVAYQTDGAATYTLTGMEDAGILRSLTNLAAAGRVDFTRILIARAVSNHDGQRPGITAAESLLETKVATYSAYLPALENAWRTGHHILHEWVRLHP